LQRNFAYDIYDIAPFSQSVAFSSPNTAGNGLIVVAYFESAMYPANPNLEISDSQGNTYQRIGACGAINAGNGLVSLLQIWYVSSCRAGANTVTVTEITSTQYATFILAVNVFEYAGGLGAVDASSFATGLSKPSLTLSLTTTAAGDLLFAYAAQFGQTATVSLAGSSGDTTEQTEGIRQLVSPYAVIIPTLAVDQVEGEAGIETITFDFTQVGAGLDTALFVALPCALPAPAPPPPSPPVPVLGSTAGWPTIF
jgi:hypothetical protein